MAAFIFYYVLGFKFAIASGLSTKEIQKIAVLSAFSNLYFPGENSFPTINLNDSMLYPAYRSGTQSITNQFINFIFPVSGKEKRVEFLPYQFWGQKKPQHKKFEWKMYESRHFNFFYYGEEQDLLKPLVRIFELHHEDNSKLFGVDNRIEKKIPIILYRTRSDFSQTHTVPYIVPETLGGFTELISWKRLIFPFEGDKTTFEHVARHEGTHVYHVAKLSKFLPLWFIEGTAEMNSIKWDASAETVIRDAYFNDFLFHIPDLWRIRGSWLMYKEGNYFANYIIDTYGEEAIRKIFNNSRKLRFDENIKASLGISLKELDSRIFSKLNAKYGKLGSKTDEIDSSKKVGTGKLMAAKGDFYVSGRFKNGKFELHLNHIDVKRGLISKRFESDFEMKSESLHTLKSRADISDTDLMYTIQGMGFDEIRIKGFSYNSRKGQILFGEAEKLTFNNISPILDPVFLDGSKIAFVGFENGYSGIYIYDRKSKNLEKITDDKSYYRGLDYSGKRKIIVFSKEEERIDKKSRYNYNLYSYSVETKAFKKLTDSEYSDLDPEISPDGSKIVYVGDKDDVFNLFFYDLENSKVIQATDVKIAAFTPRWRDNSKLYFGTIEKFEPVIYKMKVPTLKIAFSKGIPAPNNDYYSLKNGNLILAKDIQKEISENEVNFESDFIIKNDKLYIIKDNRNLLVKSFVAHESSILLVVEPEELYEWETVKKDYYFRYKKGKLHKITRSYQYDGKLDSTVLNIIGEFKKDKSIIRLWVSPESDRIFVLTNNTLSFQKDKGEQSLYLIDVEKAKITKLPYYNPLSDLKDVISNIYFLKGNKSLIEVRRRSWDWKDYHNYYIYDQITEKFRKIYSREKILSISRDSKLILTLSSDGSKLEIYDSVHDSRRVIYKPKEYTAIVNAHFIDNNNVFISLGDNKKSKVGLIFLDIEDKNIYEKYFNITPGYYFNFALSSANGDQVALKIKDTRTKTGIEKLYYYLRGSEILKEIGVELSYYDRVAFADDLLVFQGRDLDGFKTFQVYGKGIISKGYKIDSSGYSKKTNTLIIGGEEDVVKVNLLNGKVSKIIDKTFGFDVFEQNVVLSSFVDGFYNLFLFDLEKNELKRLSKSWFNELSPKLSANGLAYTVDEEKRFSVHVRKNLKNDQIDRIYLENADIYNPIWLEDTMYFNMRQIETSYDEYKVSEKAKGDFFSLKPLEIPLKIGEYSGRIKPQYVYGGLAYDGNTVLLFASLAADNIFSSKGVFVNTIYKSDFINSTVGFTNLEEGRTYTLYLNRLDENTSGGFSFMKTYLIDRYREFDLYTQLEYQGFEADQFRGDSLEYSGNSIKQLVLKSGAVLAYDASIWDYHGPSRGGKFYGKFELGINLKTAKVSNVDLNMDFRLYNQIISRVGFAHRLMAGTSQGQFPTVFFLGGNISFRGVPFDGLEGNNYWVLSEDLRIPFFDFIGAVLPGIVDRAIGPFFKFFDVRGGLYFDIGQVWFNKNDDLGDLLHSLGFFVNTPTIFGLVLRFSKGFVGEKGFNFWFGYNW